ncbi:MAG TPA: hypothetical protein VGX92_13405 [Pyrinomonadaceae bacterium]|nr:hypothetical protein [Pyrinomonadaceae bacterium]
MASGKYPKAESPIIQPSTLRDGTGARLLGGGYTIPFVLCVIGVILITISGYLGGELVFKYGVAVNPQHDTLPEERARARAS